MTPSLAASRQLPGVGEAEVLEAMGQAARMRAQRLVDAEHLVDGDVADHVNGDAPAGVVALAAQRQQVVALEAQHAAGVGMAVGDAERRGGAAQAAIGEELHRVDLQVVRVVLFGERHRLGHPVDAAQRHDVDPRRQAAAGVDRPIDVEQRWRDAAIGGRRDAERSLVAQRRHDHLLVVVG